MITPLLTDLYQVSMGYGYWKDGRAETKAVFHLSFRKAPFGEVGAIVGGIEPALEYLETLAFTKEEISYLATLQGANGMPLFEQAFLDYLLDMEWRLNVKAIPEGTLAFPQEPLLQVEGPLLQAQLVETALLNMINFETLIATKSARICEAAGDDPVMEFGLRRAQGRDGALSASRAAYLGGCVATSNVLAGMKYDIPVKGTHAHSWVMSYDDEEKAFEKYAEVMPHNTLLLVDTYDTIAGVKKAIKVGCHLRTKGHDLLGIRLDSGDLADLSIQARKLLDAAGFVNTRIVASNDLDEEKIRLLKAQGAQIDTWGVGTKLVTADGQPSLGGVYKLGAIQDHHKVWHCRMKVSDDAIKVSNPGRLQVVRTATQDLLFNELDTLPPDGTLLLEPQLQNGVRVHPATCLHTQRRYAMEQWRNRPKESPLSLHPTLEQTKRDLLHNYSLQPKA